MKIIACSRGKILFSKTKDGAFLVAIPLRKLEGKRDKEMGGFLCIKHYN